MQRTEQLLQLQLLRAQSYALCANLQQRKEFFSAHRRPTRAHTLMWIFHLMKSDWDELLLLLENHDLSQKILLSGTKTMRTANTELWLLEIVLELWKMWRFDG